MPPKIVDNTSFPPSDRRNREIRQQPRSVEVEQDRTSLPSMMATQTQTAKHPGSIQSIPNRIRLPPIYPLPPVDGAGSRPMPSAMGSVPSPQSQVPPAFIQSPYTSPNARPATSGYFPPQERSQSNHSTPISPAASSVGSVRGLVPEALIPLKRSNAGFPESPYGPAPPLSVLTPASIEPRAQFPRTILPPVSTRSTVSNVSTGSSTNFSLPGHAATYSRPPSEVSSNSITQRCSLHIRQQPRAARAGPDGKDRRNIDPPPVLQLMMNDFDPNSTTDLSELKSNHYVVHCKLISAESPSRDVTTQTTVSEDGSRETSRLLLGTNVASPFFCNDDPDIENAPQHPKSTDRDQEGPPSPSSRFIHSRAPRSVSPTPSQPPDTLPCAFFIFADLSVRRAGTYRLEFTLMKIDPSAMNLPMIHVARSSVFKVVNAKDFDQVHPSTTLVRGLLERGAPFPLKLKKGIREGQRRRTNLEEGDGSVEGSVEGEQAAGGNGGGGDDGGEEDE